LIHPISDPENDFLPMISQNTFTDNGSEGAQTFTRDHPTARRDRYASTFIFALTVFMMRSKVHASLVNVSGSFVV
jgi:hypothetical protein